MRNSRASGVRIINLTCNGSNKKYVDIIFRGWGSLWQKVESRQFDKVIDSLTITKARLFPQNVCRKISIAKAGAGSSYTELFRMYIALIHKCILFLCWYNFLLGDRSSGYSIRDAILVFSISCLHLVNPLYIDFPHGPSNWKKMPWRAR